MMVKLIVIFLLISVNIHAQGVVIDTSFISDALGFSRSVTVYLPEGYDPDGSIDYPVVYFLHGLGGNHHSYPEIYGWLDNLIDNQTIDPLIVVKPDGSIGPFGGSMYTNSVLFGNFEDYIVDDLVEFIDTSFRAIASAGKRAITGHSMGGYGCIKAGLKHPDIYRATASNSGPLDILLAVSLAQPTVLDEIGGDPPYHYWYNAGPATNLMFVLSGAFSPNMANPPYYVDFPLDSMGNIDDSVMLRWTEHNPSHLAAQLPQESELSVYFDCGNQDEFLCYPQNTAFADSLDLLGLDYIFRPFSGGHALTYSTFSITMTFLDSVMNSATEIYDRISLMPESITLSQNYPNPFNAQTTIKFGLAETSCVRLDIYDLLGRKVINLINGQIHMGFHQVIWDADDISSGVYLYRIQAGDYIETRKMTLVK